MNAFGSRRSFLRTTTILGAPALAGCLSATADSDAGTLVLSNDDDASHTVTLEVTKTSDDSDDVRGHDETPKATPIWDREDAFSLDAGERKEESDYIAEPGAYFVKATLADGTEATEWLGLYEGADGEVAADTLYVTIREHGPVNVYTSHDD